MASKPVTMPVTLYPLAAHILVTLLEEHFTPEARKHCTHEAEVDIDNFRNQLHAHLQRVAQGEYA